MSSLLGGKKTAPAPVDAATKQEEAKQAVEVQAFYMKRLLDQGKLMDALKHASSMISKLQTGDLSPKNYYALYMQTFDHLRYLEAYLYEESKKGKKMSELYELVQYAGSILPRQYLLITVGSVYVKTGEAGAREVMRDLVEMCRGVQHPTRGLFIRNYLSEMMKDKLPDVGAPGGDDERNGTVTDSIEFILKNFTEMNKLWVRMEHQALAHQKTQKEGERTELRLLVGKNLARLSQLDGVDVEKYSTLVLPEVCDQLINCKDTIAQQYLLECIIQVFPDEFHLRTLDMLLSACEELQPSVDVRAILVSLIDRLAAFADRARDDIPADVKIVEVLSKGMAAIVEARENMPAEDVLSLMVSLVNLSIKTYPKEIGYVDQIFKFTAQMLTTKQAQTQDSALRPATAKQLQRMLQIPLDNYKSVLVTLRLEHYGACQRFLAYAQRKKSAIEVARAAVASGPCLRQKEQLEALFALLGPLLKDADDQPAADDVDRDEFVEEQHLVASLVHLIVHDDVDAQFALYVVTRQQFGTGGQARIAHTLAPLVFRVLALAQRLHAARAQGDDDVWTKRCTRLYKFSHETVSVLAKQSECSELALRLYLQCAQSAGTLGFETIAYEFMSQAFGVYEEEISDSKAQYRAMTLIIGTLQGMRGFREENYETLITKCAQCSTKLLKKSDKARAVYMCSHLFWTAEGGYRDAKRVLECLQKSLKIADTCMDSSMNVRLFVEILNQYLFFYENGNEQVNDKYISRLTALINTNLQNMAADDDAKQEACKEVKAHYENSLRHIRLRKEAGDERYAAIEM